MASEKSSRSDDICHRLKQLVFCPVCRDTFKDPKILRCGHSFCASCIENVYHRSEHSNCVPCPVCRESAFPPENAISNFPNNTTILGILDIIAQHEDTQECPCGLCDSSCVQNVCMDCNIKMCSKCTFIHDKIEKESHTVLSLSNIQGTPMLDILNEKERSKYCLIHTNTELQTFCVTCNETLCTQCATGHDKWHNMLPVAKAANGVKEFLASQITVCSPDIERLENILETLTVCRETLESTSAEAMSRIHAKALECRSIIDLKEQECIKMVEQMRKAKFKLIQGLVEAAEIQLVMRMNLLQYMKSLHKFGTPVLLAKNKQAIQRQLEELRKQSPEEINLPCFDSFKIYFSENFGLLNQLKKLEVGNISSYSENLASILKPRYKFHNITAISCEHIDRISTEQDKDTSNHVHNTNYTRRFTRPLSRQFVFSDPI